MLSDCNSNSSGRGIAKCVGEALSARRVSDMELLRSTDREMELNWRLPTQRWSTNLTKESALNSITSR